MPRRENSLSDKTKSTCESILRLDKESIDRQQLSSGLSSVSQQSRCINEVRSLVMTLSHCRLFQTHLTSAHNPVLL